MPIPGWKNEEIGALGTVITGKTPSTKNDVFWQGDIPFITPPDLRGNSVRQAQRSITADGMAVVNEIPQGAVMVCCIGSIGLTGICEVERAATNQQINSVIVDPSRADARYFHYAIMHNRPALLTAAQMTTVPILNKSNFSRIRLWLPPLTEQRQIAVVLSTVQQAIERQERLIALTAELKKALMHKLFTEGTRGEPLKQTEIGPVPCNWQTLKLADAVDYIDYGISAPIPKTVPPDGIKIVSTADITKDGEILYGKIRQLSAPARTVQRLTLKHGDVLFNWRNSSELIGKSSVFEEQAEPHVFASFILRIRCDEVRSHNAFLAYLMNYYREQGIFIKLSRRAVNQANYNRNEISVLGIPLPPIDEQLEIARAITSVVNSRTIHVRRRDTLQSLFRTLLYQLMTAQVRVHDLDLSALEEAERGPVGAM